jgi:hypothetical protein
MQECAQSYGVYRINSRVHMAAFAPLPSKLWIKNARVNIASFISTPPIT